MQRENQGCLSEVGWEGQGGSEDYSPFPCALPLFLLTGHHHIRAYRPDDGRNDLQPCRHAPVLQRPGGLELLISSFPYLTTCIWFGGRDITFSFSFFSSFSFCWQPPKKAQFCGQRQFIENTLDRIISPASLGSYWAFLSALVVMSTDSFTHPIKAA